ncbi:FAD-dependent oxidoreductase [Blastococcus mobilis]|uniref:3-phenylpropionate/trans-cinnamate dioxygenase ferredoxin reductase subunit n=1 Tax=Blastococcus mobilis TaxID=1938746 RepID=A0A238ZG32_9ACTN|nr:FAD-dependent oxidoreductase [Blastococcus mobilis]SNR82082.1 3-phenylpropionate/trans-cinnamate dioxygenase ferredoxin reductase subunit [Blastococcus mobilis]
MTTRGTMVIVGAGLAGASAAEALRAEGFAGRIVLIGEEPELPYDRPPLSKGYLSGETPRAQVHLQDSAFYADHDIELLTGTRITDLDRNGGQLVVDTGERLGFDRLLLATGAVPRRLPVPGGDLAGVHYLRTLADADALRQDLRPGGHLVVVGAGWIGAEIAASARQQGMEVTVLDPAPVPLARVLGPEVGEFYRRLHAGHGVQLLMRTGVEAFRGTGRVQEVLTSDGRRIDAHAVVVGIGVQPRTELAERAGLIVDDGVVVDELLRTGDPRIFAAGDIARARHSFYDQHVRVEHWATARDQGVAAARGMLGRGASYDALPYFFSDQYDTGMEYRGRATRWDRVVFRGDPDSREFLAFWLQDGRVLAGMNVNVWNAGDDVEALLRSRAQVDPDRLADPRVPLAEVSPPPLPTGGGANKTGVLSGPLKFVRQFLRDRFTVADATPADELAVGEGRVLDVAGEKVAVYKDPAGNLHGLSPVCTHARCLVQWSAADTAWNCPCHGARFSPTGQVLRGPAKKDLAPRPLPAIDRHDTSTP